MSLFLFCRLALFITFMLLQWEKTFPFRNGIVWVSCHVLFKPFLMFLCRVNYALEIIICCRLALLGGQKIQQNLKFLGKSSTIYNFQFSINVHDSESQNYVQSRLEQIYTKWMWRSSEFPFNGCNKNLLSWWKLFSSKRPMT